MKIIEDYVKNGSYDYVCCNQCCTEMLVPVGVDKCPHCQESGYLSDLEEPEQWSDDTEFRDCELPVGYDPLND